MKPKIIWKEDPYNEKHIDALVSNKKIGYLRRCTDGSVDEIECFEGHLLETWIKRTKKYSKYSLEESKEFVEKKFQQWLKSIKYVKE